MRVACCARCARCRRMCRTRPAVRAFFRMRIAGRRRFPRVVSALRVARCAAGAGADQPRRLPFDGSPTRQPAFTRIESYLPTSGPFDMAAAKRSNVPSCFSAGRRTRADRRCGESDSKDGNRDCGRWFDESVNHDGGTPAAAPRIASGERMPRRPGQQPGRRAKRCRQTASRNCPAISASFSCGANISISRYAYARRNAPLRSPTRVVLASNRCCVSSATRPVSRCGS